MTRPLTDILALRAGPEARAAIARDGVAPDMFSAMLGASGGPKWLALARLDRYLAGEFFRERNKPLALLGTSIGCWRHACFAQHDPLAAMDRFLAAYLAQRYSAKPGVEELTREAERLLDVLLGERGAVDIATHRVWRTHILAVRCRGLLASDRPPILLTGLTFAALLNGLSRASLALSFERVIFAPGDDSDFHLEGMPALDVPLDAGNVRDSLLATAAVPLVFAPRRNIAGAPVGTYRDGGITDYHFDMAIDAPPGLVLYPHFYDHLVPGWFDKSLRWRRATGPLTARTLLVSPAPAFVASLPARAIPDRRDFTRYDDTTRERHWHAAVAASEQLAEAFDTWRADPDPARWLTPL